MSCRERGYGAVEIIGGAFLFSLFLSGAYVTAQWMRSVKAERLRQRNPHLQAEHAVKEVKPGKEFGSYVITFEL